MQYNIEFAIAKIERLTDDLARFKRQGLNSRNERVKYYKAELRDWTNYRNQLMSLACPRCPASDIKFGKVIMVSGEVHIAARCGLCNRNPSQNGPWLKKTNFPNDVIETLVVFDDFRLNNPPCEVCGALGTELHHWAPREYFKDECENWPKSYLCPTHHKEWHLKIRKR